MHVMVFVKATEDSEKGLMDMKAPQVQKLMEDMGRFNDELLKAGIMKKETDCAGMKPSSYGKRVAFDGTGRTVIDGPFGNPNDLVTGYWMWEVKDMDEAVAWVKRCPNPMFGPSEIEIRPLYEDADFQ